MYHTVAQNADPLITGPISNKDVRDQLGPDVTVWLLLVMKTRSQNPFLVAPPTGSHARTARRRSLVEHHRDISFVSRVFFCQFATESYTLGPSATVNDIAQSFLSVPAWWLWTPKHYKVHACSQTLPRTPEGTPTTSQSTIPDTRRGLVP